MCAVKSHEGYAAFVRQPIHNNSVISLEDCAIALVDELETPGHSRQRLLSATEEASKIVAYPPLQALGRHKGRGFGLSQSLDKSKQRDSNRCSTSFRRRSHRKTS